MYGNGTSFNGILSPDTFDHGAAALQREHEARRKEMDRQERCERWILREWDGVTFDSFEALQRTVLLRATLERGALDAETFRVLTNAARAVFSGLCTPSKSTRVLSERGTVESVTVHAPLAA